MPTNKLVFKYCPNFERIINTDFLEGDNLSNQLVKIYQDFIFKVDLNLDEEKIKVQEIDRIMGKYVEDYFFRKTLQKEILQVKVKKSGADIIRLIVENIIQIFRKYELESTRKIYISKWI